MRFMPTPVEGAFIVEQEGYRDARGYFARIFCEKIFADAAIDMRIVQANLSRNPHKGTLRGLHYQAEPHGEPRVVQCIRGRVFDVAVDLRPRSPSYLRWVGVELGADQDRTFYIPAGCAHGFLTLEDNSDILYLMGHHFVPDSASGARWNDPIFAIQWPGTPSEISDRDAAYPDFRRASNGD